MNTLQRNMLLNFYTEQELDQFEEQGIDEFRTHGFKIERLYRVTRVNNVNRLLAEYKPNEKYFFKNDLYIFYYQKNGTEILYGIGYDKHKIEKQISEHLF